MIILWKKLILITLLSYSLNSKINYPITNINSLDNEMTSYIDKIKKRYKDVNITYKYRDINENVLNVIINAETKNKNIVKTYTYDKSQKKYLTIEDIIKNTNALDYTIKNELIKKHQEINLERLNEIKINSFTFEDDNLKLFLNISISNNNSETIHLDIPLNTLDLLIKVEDEKYYTIKKKDIDIDDKIVSLTFDDGPSKYTNEILDILKRNDATATFFVVGDKSLTQGQTLRRILKEGSEIGNHSFDHKVLTYLKEEEFKEQINKTQNIIKDLTGFTPQLFRPTYGGYTNKLKTYTDLTFILWDIDSKDWKVKTKEKIIENVIPNVKSGSIVLFHDNHIYAVDALEEIITNLKTQGYKFVTVSELLEIKKMREEN